MQACFSLARQLDLPNHHANPSCQAWSNMLVAKHTGVEPISVLWHMSRQLLAWFTCQQRGDSSFQNNNCSSSKGWHSCNHISCIREIVSESIFYWKKSKEHHWRLSSVEDVFTLLPSTCAKSLALLVVGLSNCWSDWLKLTLVDCKNQIGLSNHLPSTFESANAFSKQFMAVPSQMVLYNKPSGATSRYSLVL